MLKFTVDLVTRLQLRQLLSARSGDVPRRADQIVSQGSHCSLLGDSLGKVGYVILLTRCLLEDAILSDVLTSLAIDTTCTIASIEATIEAHLDSQTLAFIGRS